MPRSSRPRSSRSGGATGSTRSDVQRALWVDRTLVKTFGPRGTVHLLATADLPMWTGALSALPSSAPGFPEPIRFTPEEAEAVIAGIGAALADAELTIDELTDALRERVGPWAVEQTMPAFQVLWPRWRQLTSTAAHRGVLCFGHDRGRNVTYTNPHRWLPGFVPEDGATALRTLVRDYLHAYGPATPQHFAKWLNVPPRRAVEAVRGHGGRAGARRARGDAGLGGRGRRVGAGGRRRRGSGCCRTSTPTSSPRSPASGSTRARRGRGPSARQARRATTR